MMMKFNHPLPDPLQQLNNKKFHTKKHVRYLDQESGQKNANKNSLDAEKPMYNILKPKPTTLRFYSKQCWLKLGFYYG